MTRKWDYWTCFHDVNSGGKQKTVYRHILVKAPIKEATIIFKERFGINPEHVTCRRCGKDYDISQGKSIRSKNFPMPVREGKLCSTLIID